jgi:hypothetical protein
LLPQTGDVVMIRMITISLNPVYSF